MSWLCKNCETLNDDNDNICLVCNSVPPTISEISLDCRKSQVSWAYSNVNQLTLRCSQGDFNVTGLTSTSIDISVVETLVFIAKNDVAERLFRVTLPRSFVQEVIKYKKDDETWILASRRGTREDIEYYLSLYPEGQHIRAANNRLSKIEEEEKAQIAADEAAWKTTIASKTESAYRYYITHFPSGIHIVEANKLLKQLIKERDDKNWEKAISINTIEAYREYISVSENKTREKEANSRISKIIDENDWKTASRLDTIEGYVEYINKHHYPHSNIHWSEAQSAIKRLRDAEDEKRWKHACGDDSLEAYKDYLSKCPEGNHIVECKFRIIDEKAWQLAKQSNTKDSYSMYVIEHPSGKYVLEASNRIDELKKGKGSSVFTRVFVFLIVIFIAVQVTCFVIDSIIDITTDPGPIDTTGTTVSPGQSGGGVIYTPRVVNLSELESETERLIHAMEITKNDGSSIDVNIYNKTRKNLESLYKGGSVKYLSLKKRYDSLQE